MSVRDEAAGTCELMERAAAGRRHAIEVLLARYRPLIEAEARRCPPGLREDALQEIRCLLIEALPKFRSPIGPSGARMWLDGTGSALLDSPESTAYFPTHAAR